MTAVNDAAGEWPPNLSEVFYAYSDDDDLETVDHALDSCCLSLNRSWLADDESKWLEVLDQHAAAFSALASDAAARAVEDRSWYLGRPLVFSAHHVIELALKSVTLAAKDEWRGANGRSGHLLEHLLGIDRRVNGVRPTAAWENEFVRLLDQAQEGGRYPTSVRAGALLDQWCCVSATALDKSVTAFLYFTVPQYRGPVDDD